MDAGSESVHDVENDDRVTRRVIPVCEAVGDFIAYWGFKAIHGRIWTLLALRRSPMTQVEVAGLLRVSRSLVSGSMAELTRLGLVRAVDERRNAPYEAVLDVWPTISDVLRSREWMLVERTRMALEGALDEIVVIERSGGTTTYDAGRLRVLLAMTDMAQAMLRMLIRMRTLHGPSMDTMGHWLGKATELIGKIRSPFS